MLLHYRTVTGSGGGLTVLGGGGHDSTVSCILATARGGV